MSGLAERSRTHLMNDNPGELSDDVMTITREYFSSPSPGGLRHISAVISSSIANTKAGRMYARWLLSRNDRKCVVDVCRTLLEVNQSTAAMLKQEIESEVIVHVAVDLLCEFLKAGLKFSQFFECDIVRTQTDVTDDPVNAIWGFMIFRSQLCSKPGNRYDQVRPAPSERFAYLVIDAIIQACSLQPDCLEGLAYIIQKYPIHPMDVYTYGKVFRGLVMAGIGPSTGFLREMDGSVLGSVLEYYDVYRTWYEEYRREVPSLKQCARLAVRRVANVNMEHAVTRLDVPGIVADMLLLRDAPTLAMVNADDRD